MTAKLARYPAYKPSGVEWLGDVPAHCEVRRAKYLYREVNERSITGEEELMSVSHKTGVTPRKKNVTMFRAETNVGYKLCRPGDIVINTMWAYMAALGVARQVGLVSPSYNVYRPIDVERLNQDFMDPLLRTESYRVEYFVRSTGITVSRLRLYPESFLEIPLLHPPIEEQAAIVRYLDHVDGRIQRYIEAKEKLISLLQEARRATIQRAVTRGLNPYVPLKPSGVEWLEDVPAHWEVRRLKTLCSMKSGDGISVMSIEPVGEYPVYGGNGLRGYTSRYNHDGAFALIGRQGALCGNVHIAQGKFWATEHAVVATHDTGHDVEWFGAILTAMNLNQYSIAAAQPGLAIERILHLHLPVPPVHEQKLIAAHLDNATAAIDAAIDTARRQSELMREYLTSLIAHVVTGKLDVRKTAAHFPLESSEEISTVR